MSSPLTSAAAPWRAACRSDQPPLRPRSRGSVARAGVWTHAAAATSVSPKRRALQHRRRTGDRSAAHNARLIQLLSSMAVVERRAILALDRTSCCGCRVSDRLCCRDNEDGAQAAEDRYQAVGRRPQMNRWVRPARKRFAACSACRADTQRSRSSSEIAPLVAAAVAQISACLA
jgi:hypothetical protein